MPILNMTWWWASWPKIPLNDISTLSAEAWVKETTLKWTDVWDLVVNWVTANSWDSTKLVRKVGSAPSNSSDGTLVTTETTLNQYQTNGYVDTWLTAGTTYYYKAFSVGSNWLESWSNSVSAVPTSWWKPWANTIAYYPLETNWNDYNWNYNLTNVNTPFTTVSWVKCANFSTNVYLYSSSLPLPSWANSRTLSFWTYINAATHDTYFCAYGSHWTGNFFAPNINSGKYFFMGYARDFSTWINVTTWVWQNHILTYNGTTVKWYMNGSLIAQSNQSLNTTGVWSTWKFTVGCRLDSSATPNQYLNWYMCKLIWENVVWSATDVSNYWNLEKGNFWLS